jgi:hypothetical protein
LAPALHFIFSYITFFLLFFSLSFSSNPFLSWLRFFISPASIVVYLARYFQTNVIRHNALLPPSYVMEAGEVEKSHPWQQTAGCCCCSVVCIISPEGCVAFFYLASYLR